MNRKLSFGELIIDRNYDAFGQTVVALLAAYVIKKTNGVTKITFDDTIGKQLYTLPLELSENNQLSKVLEILEHNTISILDKERIEEIVFTVEGYEAYYADCFDKILDVFAAYSSDNQLYLRTIDDKEIIDDTLGDLCGKSVFDPFGTFALNGKIDTCDSYYGMDSNALTWALGILRFDYYNIDSTHFLNEDFFSNSNPFNRKYDVVYIDMPSDYDSLSRLAERINFDIRDVGRREYEIGLNCMNDNGFMFYLTRHTPLFGGGMLSITTQMIETQRLESATMMAITSLEEQTYKNAIILKIGQEYRGSWVDFYGWGDFDFLQEQGMYMKGLAVQVGDSDVRDMGYSLLPNEYILGHAYNQLDTNGRPIRKLNEILRRAKSKLVLDGNKNRTCFTNDDFPASAFDCIVDVDNLENTSEQSTLQKYTYPVLLTNISFGDFKRAFVFASEQKPVFTDLILAFEVSPLVSVDYLLAFLASDEFESQRRVLCATTARLDYILNKTYIPVPSLQEQEEYVRKAMTDRLTVMELEQVEDAKRMQEEYMRNMRVQKHALGQEMLQIRTKVNRLFNVIERRSLIDRAMEMSSSTGATYGDYKESINSHIATLTGMIETLSGEMKYGALDSISLIEFFREWCVNHKTEANYQWDFVDDFDRKEPLVIPIHDEDYDSEGKITTIRIVDSHTISTKIFPWIKIPKKALEQILRNIADNSSQYAFTSPDRLDYKIRVEIVESGNTIIVRILNNGNPLSESMDKDHLLEYGYGHNTGLGIWQMKRIMDEFGLAMRVIDSKEDEFPFGFEFDFKDESKLSGIILNNEQ